MDLRLEGGIKSNCGQLSRRPSSGLHFPSVQHGPRSGDRMYDDDSESLLTAELDDNSLPSIIHQVFSLAGNGGPVKRRSVLCTSDLLYQK